jgi:hypothetical protein
MQATDALKGSATEGQRLREVIWSGHKALLVDLIVKSSVLVRSYGLGRELAETTLLVDTGDRESFVRQFDASRLTIVQATLHDMAECLPTMSAGTVAASLEIWKAWTMSTLIALEWSVDVWRSAGQARRRQDSRWRPLLVGEASPTRSLTPKHYLAAGNRFLSRIGNLATGLVANRRVVGASLAITVALALVLAGLMATDHLPAVFAGSFLFLESFVTSAAELASAASQGAGHVAAPLGQAELEAAMAEANTFVLVVYGRRVITAPSLSVLSSADSTMSISEQLEPDRLLPPNRWPGNPLPSPGNWILLEPPTQA